MAPNNDACAIVENSIAIANDRKGLRFQPIDATHELKRSAGVSKSNVFLGRSNLSGKQKPVAVISTIPRRILKVCGKSRPVAAVEASLWLATAS